MDPSILIFLSSGLFLGWSLGANDAANVFGTAVGSRMVRFTTAALICAVFVVLGAVISGAGATKGLSELGAVNALAGSFSVALAAAITVFSMTRSGLPVSTTQAVIGAIVGWNWFSGSVTDLGTLSKIVGTWIAGPILGAIFALVLYKVTVRVIHWAKLHLVWLDMWTRLGLLLAGAFGAYSLGANNIANVMGVFVPASPLQPLEVGELFTLTSTQQLFLLGAIAIGVGAFYSRRVMITIGGGVLPVGPVAAWVVVVAHSLVLFVFSSETLQTLVTSVGLPPIPLIPVSSSQAVVGAVIGVGLAHGLRSARNIDLSILGKIVGGWVATPVAAAILCFIALFVVNNVFQQDVYVETRYRLTPDVIRHVEAGTDPIEGLQAKEVEFRNAVELRRSVRRDRRVDRAELERILEAALLSPTRIDPDRLATIDARRLRPEDAAALDRLSGTEYQHVWQLADAMSHAGAPQDDAGAQTRLRYIARYFAAAADQGRR